MRHLRILRYVDAVARCGSIRKAAQQLNVTASAINRRILDLECELGSPIFERTPRGVRLTAAGEAFVSYLRDQNANAERMRSEIEALKGLRRGTVRIACSQALAMNFVPRSIAAFRERYPLIKFEARVLSHNQAIVELIDYAIDLAIVFQPAAHPDFHAIKSLKQRLVALMRASHPLARRATIGLRDCARYPVALPESNIAGRQLLDEISARSGLTFQIAAESNSFELLRGLVRHADTVSFQFQIGSMQDVLSPDLVAREIEDSGMLRYNLVLGQVRGRVLPVPSVMFAEYLARLLDTQNTGHVAKSRVDRGEMRQGRKGAKAG